MKEFRKTDDGLFICEECNTLFHKKDKLAYHINKKHNDLKTYYDKWLKEEGEGLCKICKKQTEFTGFKYYYNNCCSKECSKQYKISQTVLSNIKHFGVKYASQRKDVNEKQRNTWKNKSKEERHEIRKKIENTWMNNYGVTNNMVLDFVKNKFKETSITKYGVDNPSKNKEIKEKRKKTLQKTLKQKYGVENVSQVNEFFEKSQKKQLRLKQFRNTDLWYQGTYELDFLERYYDKYPDMKRGPSIRYIYNKKVHYYHPDFYIPSLNLIIEIKNINLYNKDKQKIDAKENFTKKEGFNYIIIIEKNYSNLNL